MDAREATATLMQLVNGYQVSQAIHVAAALGIADLLADGPRTSNDLAQAAGADADALYRVLRALASVGVLNEEEGRLFSLTPVGEPLRSDVPGSLHGWAVCVADGPLGQRGRLGRPPLRSIGGPWHQRCVEVTRLSSES